MNETKYHTLAHIALRALQDLYGDNTKNEGCNMNDDRLRIDFSLDRKMTEEEKIKLVDIINSYIDMNIDVTKEEMTLEEAHNCGAHGDFSYGDKVTVYKIGNISNEICGGPHVNNTSELSHVKLIKEESSSKGVRRIKLQMI